MGSLTRLTVTVTVTQVAYLRAGDTVVQVGRAGSAGLPSGAGLAGLPAIAVIEPSRAQLTKRTVLALSSRCSYARSHSSKCRQQAAWHEVARKQWSLGWL